MYDFIYQLHSIQRCGEIQTKHKENVSHGHQQPAHEGFNKQTHNQKAHQTVCSGYKNI